MLRRTLLVILLLAVAGTSAGQQRLAVFAAAGPGTPPPELLDAIDAVVRRELVLALDPARYVTLMADAAAPGCTGRCAVTRAAEYGATLALGVRVAGGARPDAVSLTVYGAPDGFVLARREVVGDAPEVLAMLVGRAAREVAAALAGEAPARPDQPLRDPRAEERVAARRAAELAEAAGENSVGMTMILVLPDRPFRDPPPGQEYIQARPLPAPDVPYLLAATEVTQAQWRAVMGDDPGEFPADRKPVQRVSWLDAVRFCNHLSEREGFAPVYRLEAGTARLHPGADGYRLPSDAEWEYACRAGSLTMFAAGGRRSDLARTAWFAGNAGREPERVARRDANAWGFHDMHGNVWEWVWDAYASLPDLSRENIESPGIGPDRTIRGGSWYTPAIACRTTNFCRIDPAFRSCDLGFRVARRP